MTHESRRLAGILLILLPAVIFGGLWRAVHAYAGVLLVLSLIILRYVDEARLSKGAKRFVRSSVPMAAILLPLALFLSVLSPNAQEPNALIYLAYLGAVLLVAGVFTLGIGLVRSGEYEG